MHRAPLATRAATITINDGKGLRAAAVSVRGFLSFQMELVHMAAVTRQCFVAEPSPKRARASSQGQAMLSPVDLNIQAVVKILRWRLQQGGTPSSLEQLESDFFRLVGMSFLTSDH